jgi:GT2 family glycosyltransferase
VTLSPSVSIIVPCYNSATTLRSCLSGLVKQEYPCFRVIVVDDGSTDATCSIAVEFAVTLLRTGINRGPGAARNLAVREFPSEIVVFFDSDCFVQDTQWLRRHVEAQRNPSVGIVGGGILGVGEGLVAQADSYCHWLTNIPNARPIDITFTSGPSLTKLSCHLVSTNMSVKLQVFDKIGGFDERFRTGEDVDFCERTVRAGFTIRFQPDITVNHWDRCTLREFVQSYYRMGKDRIAVRRKHRTRFMWLLPRGLLSSVVMFLPLALALPLQPIFAWWPYKKRVVLYYPIMFLATLATAVGLVSSCLSSERTSSR